MIEDKSMHQKYKDGEISATDYNNHLAQKNGFKDWKDYQNHLAQKNGFKDYNDYHNKLKHKSGKSQPFTENKSCSSYLGVHIAERVLSHIFDSVTRMPLKNPGFDFICKKGFKIEVKSSCLSKYNKWNFNIRKNKIANYFLFLAFDNREDLNPMHVWSIKGSEVVGIHEKRKGILNEKKNLMISTNPKFIKAFKPYEIKDKLEKAVCCCDKLEIEGMFYPGEKI